MFSSFLGKQVVGKKVMITAVNGKNLYLADPCLKKLVPWRPLLAETDVLPY